LLSKFKKVSRSHKSNHPIREDGGKKKENRFKRGSKKKEGIRNQPTTYKPAGH